MPTLTIRNLDEDIRDELRIQAARHGRSMEAEVRLILKRHIRQNKFNPKQLADRIHQRFANIEDGDLPLPERGKTPDPVDFDQ